VRLSQSVEPLLPIRQWAVYAAGSFHHVMTSRLRILPSILCACALVATVHAAAPDVVLADFEGSDYGAWKKEGTAFGDGPAHGTLPGQMAVSGFAGKGLVNSFSGGDPVTGKLTSPKFRTERKYLSFLIGGDRSESPKFASKGSPPFTEPMYVQPNSCDCSANRTACCSANRTACSACTEFMSTAIYVILLPF
jgi:hypothetical protein